MESDTENQPTAIYIRTMNDEIFRYKENPKSLMKEMKEEVNGEVSHVHGQENSMVSRCRFFPS